jgi:hypothetical protein
LYAYAWHIGCKTPFATGVPQQRPGGTTLSLKELSVILTKQLLIATALAAVIGAGRAEAYSITDRTANQNGVAFQANPLGTGFNFGGAITASFSYSGPLTFNDTAPQNGDSTGDKNGDFFNPGYISSYTSLGGTLASPANANFNGVANFLASSGSASGYQYGSYMTIDLGVLASGTILTITHDDGASVYQGASVIGTMTEGPTTAVTETVTLSSTGDTTLYYARENGTPSVLDVSVPEPAGMTVIGAGLLALGLARRLRTVRRS